MWCDLDMRDEPQYQGQKRYEKIVVFLFVHGLYDIVNIFVDGGVVAHFPVPQEILL